MLSFRRDGKRVYYYRNLRARDFAILSDGGGGHFVFVGVHRGWDDGRATVRECALFDWRILVSVLCDRRRTLLVHCC